MNGRRRRKGAAARIRPFWIAIVLVLVAAMTGAYYGAGWHGFHARHVAVTGSGVVSKSEIVQRAAIDGQRNLWLQNMGAAATRVRAIPYIKTVHIARRLPADVTIAVSERMPFAILSNGTQRALVDDELRVLEPQTDRTDLPEFRWKFSELLPGRFLRAERLAHMAADCKVLQGAGLSVRRMSLDRLGNLEAWLRSAILVEFGDDGDLLQKARLVNPILLQAPRGGRRIRALDLRAPKTPVLVFVR